MKKIFTFVLIVSLFFAGIGSVSAADSFNAYEKTFAIDFTDLGYNEEFQDHIRPVEVEEYYVDGKPYLGYHKTGEYAVYKNMDFGSAGAVKFQAKVAAKISDGVPRPIEIRVDAPDGRLIGTLEVTNTGEWTKDFQVQETDVETVTGVHDLYLIWPGNASNISSFQFVPAASNPSTGDAGMMVYVLLSAAAGTALLMYRRKAVK